MKAKTNVSKTKSRRGFTLVEMIVVIGMIAALAGISFPVYKSIQKKVEKQQTQMMWNSLERAVDNFETEYNYLPYLGAAYPTAPAMIKEEAGEVTQLTTALAGLGNTCNFKKIKFFDFNEPKGGPGNYTDGLLIDEVAGTAKLYTPHGGEYFRMEIDWDNDGVIDRPYGLALRKKIVVWERGPDEQWYGYGGTVNDDLTNFDDVRPK